MSAELGSLAGQCAGRRVLEGPGLINPFCDAHRVFWCPGPFRNPFDRLANCLMLMISVHWASFPSREPGMKGGGVGRGGWGEGGDGGIREIGLRGCGRWGGWRGGAGKGRGRVCSEFLILSLTT